MHSKEKLHRTDSVSLFKKFKDHIIAVFTPTEISHETIYSEELAALTHSEKMAAFYVSNDSFGEYFYPGIRMDESYKKTVLDVFVAALEKIRGKKVVDIGSGTGEATAYLEAAGLKVVSLDVSSIATAKQAQFHPEWAVVQANAVHLPFSHESIDGIHFKDALVHIPDKDTFFDHAFKTLRPLGIMVIVTADGRLDNHHGFFRTNPDETLESIRKSGFNLIKYDEWMPQDSDHDWYVSGLTHRHVWWLQKPIVE